jgi:hypothetical protein
MQVLHPEMFAAKMGRGHALYEEARAEATTAERREVPGAEMRELYSEVTSQYSPDMAAGIRSLQLGNRLFNSASERTKAFCEASAQLKGCQSRGGGDFSQASVSTITQGKPSHVANVTDMILAPSSVS